MTSLICLAATFLFLGIFIIPVVLRQRRANTIIESVREDDTLFLTSAWDLARYEIAPIDMPQANRKLRWRRAVMSVGDKGVALYDLRTGIDGKFAFTPGELRWFGRPTKYIYGMNEMWLHVQIGVAWYIVKARFHITTMQALVRALKHIATDEQVIAYRRRRPYIHRDLTPAYLAEQDIHGAWELKQRVDLYLMPLHLVLFRHGEVDRVIDLHDIQNIAAFKRLDAPEADGLLRFSTGVETLAFALQDYGSWADSLAEAAKRTLEEPPIRKQKSQDDDDWDVEDEYEPEAAVRAAGE